MIVFNRYQTVPPVPQIIAYALRDAKGQNICIAHIKSVQRDRETGAILPRVVKFEWPAQKLSITMELNNLQVIKMDKEKAGRIFTRKSLNRLPTTIQIDLTKEHMQARYREEVLKLSGRPDRPLSLRLLQEQLRAWTDKEKQAALCITCAADADYATLKAILAACREAGIHKIELRTNRQAAPD